MFHRMPRILRSALIVLLVFSGFTASSQNCIEIESILADACDGGGSPEGNNEMFRFKTGANPVSILEITMPNAWPSDPINGFPFNGFVQNATTAAKRLRLMRLFKTNVAIWLNHSKESSQKTAALLLLPVTVWKLLSIRLQT